MPFIPSWLAESAKQKESELIRKFIMASLIGASVAVAAPALAQMVVGAEVKDPAGGFVGTITKVEGDNVILKTDKHEVALPSTSFAKGDSGYLMGMTQAELNAAVEASLAEAAKTMVVGASVRGSDGNSVGTIEAIDDEFVTLALAGGQKARLPRAAVAATPQGPVIGLTLAQLEAQVGGASAGGASE